MTSRPVRRPSSTPSGPAPTAGAQLGDLDLVAAAQGGDGDAFELLVQRYRRFVRSRSRGYFLVGGDRDDLAQEALIGFYKAVRDFRPEEGASFRSFAELCITRQLITAIKAAARMMHTPLNQAVSISRPRGDEGDDTPDEEQLGPAPAHADPLEQLVAREELTATHAALAASLSPLEVEVLSRFVAGASYETIAAEVDRHTKAVDNALQRVKRKVTQHLDERAALDLVG